MTRRTTTEESAEVEDRELVAAVKSGKKIQEAVDKWIGRYGETFVTALTEMHTFFFSICGCKGVVTPQMSTTLSYKDIVCKMTEEFDEESADYPLVQGGSLKKFRANLHTFIHCLISQIKSSMLFDSSLMDGFVQLLSGMADSQVRAFRHTGTFCAMKILSALVDVTIELTQSKEKTSKQIEAEKAKLKNSSAGNEKYEALIAQRTQTEERAEEIRQIIGYLFRSVFVHRYRDVVPDIRCICIQELGHWMDVYPEHFVEDSYLKYIGWSLFDKQGEVRHRCISALIPLFEKESTLDKLELFVNKFKERLVSMLLDKDQDTSIETLHLMRVLYTHFPTLLTIKDCVPLYELIYASSRQLAVAAALFLNTKVFKNPEKPTKTPSAKNAPLLKDLVTFFLEGDLHSHGTYLIDAFFDSNPIVKDWATMCDLLLNDQYQLDPKFESVLIDFLTCSVNQASTGESPVGRQCAKKGAPSAKEARDLVDDRARLTDILIPLIPRLLTRFSSDSEKVLNLVSIPMHFQLDMYLSARMQTHLTELVVALDSLVEKHLDEELLRAVAELYYHLSSYSSISATVDSHKMKLLDGVAAFIRKSVQHIDDDNMGEEDEALFVSYIKRMAAFAGFMDLRHWDLWDLLIKIISNYNREDSQRDVRERAMQMLFVQLVFDLANLTKEGETPKADQIRKLKKKRDQLIRIIIHILQEEASGVEQAYLAACDLMIMFGSHLADDNADLKSLVWRPEGGLLADMQVFISINVFDATISDDIEQQKKIEMMHRMRQLVAQYAKLIVHGAIAVPEASTLIKRYMTHYNDFGDIFKNLLAKCREISWADFGVMIMETLKTVYLELDRREQTDPLSERFGQVRELGKRLAPAFGSDFLRNRYGITSLHRKAIDFAFHELSADGVPVNIHFLEIALDFSGKLLAQDKIAVLRYLQKVYEKKIGNVEQIMEPYRLYMVSLKESKDDDNMSVRSGMTVASNSTMRSTSSRGRGRGRRARVVDDF